MDWLIEALRVLREVRDWAEGSRVAGASADAATAVPEPAPETERPTPTNGASVRPIGPASSPPAPRAAPLPSSARGESARRRRGAPGREAQISREQEIPLDQIDPHAISTLTRLRRFGFKAYLVGGCVRDLLLGFEPKDFDIATDAKPEEVKQIFRNSRIIGRRFRLVHLYFHGGKIIEVSTFRANVNDGEEIDENQDLLIRRDNVFGSEEEDARRRDFTINGLFYDITTGRIIDHVRGLYDVEARTLRMIGDPDIRLREDPIRILRAIRFAAKTNLRIEPELREAIPLHKDEISRCAAARVLEETLRLLRIGHAARTVELMEELGVLQLLLPEVASFLAEDGSAPATEDAPARASNRERMFKILSALDGLVERGLASDAVVLGALAYALVDDALEAADGNNVDRTRALDEVLATVGARIAVTRKLSDHMRQMFLAQRHMGRAAEANRRRRRRTNPQAILHRSLFPDVLYLYEIYARAVGEPLDEVHDWYERGLDEGIDMLPLPRGETAPQRERDDEDSRDDDEPKKRRRRGRGRRKASPAGAEPSAPPDRLG